MEHQEILDYLSSLCAIDSPSGFTEQAAEYLMNTLSEMGYAPVRTRKGGVTVELGGTGNPLLVMAHVDTLGAVISAIKPNGRLALSPVGGLRAENCETENVKVYPRFAAPITGVFQLNNASLHVNKDYGEKKRNFQEMEVLLDAPVTKAEEARALGLDVGDFVCFDPRTVITESGYIKSRFLDDKLSAAILLSYARRMREESLSLNRKVVLHFTVYEEVGHGAASSIPGDVTELLSVDMGCVGEGLQCTERQVSICAKDSGGPYHYAVTTALVEQAKAHQIDYALDVYPSYGSDAEAALRAGIDAAHGLIGPGVYASHGYERAHVDGAVHTLNLLLAYTKAVS